MPSYVVAGASRGLGYEFVRQLAQDKSNAVFGLVRNKAATEERLAKDGIKNVTIFSADITDVPALQAAAAEIAKATGENGLDVLINNAAMAPERSALYDMSFFEGKPDILKEDLLEAISVNVVGTALTIDAFLPLIKKSKTKKVITISSGMADVDLINEFEVGMSGPYSISKAAVNALIAKYNVAYKAEGILFMSVSPGFVDTSEGKQMTEEEQKLVAPMVQSFMRYQPNFKGPTTMKDSVETVLTLAHKATVKEFGGAFVSHFGNKQWL